MRRDTEIRSVKGSRATVARFGLGKGGGRGDGGRDDSRDRKGIGESGNNAVQLVIAYFKQETLEPLKGLGRFLLFGIVGSLAITVGAVLALVAVLRVLQTETGAFHGNLSWIPYLIVIALAAVIIGLSIWRIAAGPARRRVASPSPAGPMSKGE
jgi:hypothetical protein